MPVIEALLFSLLVVSSSLPHGAGQTVAIGIEPCFGINSLTHRTQLRSMYSGAAYTLKTHFKGIPLTGAPRSESTRPHACAFAFAIPTHHQFQFVTIYVKRAQLNVTTNATSGEASLAFIGSSLPTSPLATVKLTNTFPIRRDFYVDTFTWPRNSTVIYVFLVHDFIGNKSGDARFYLEIALTPTYLCVMTHYQVQGSHVSLRNLYEISLVTLNEMFHPGWLICSTPFGADHFGLAFPYRFVAYCVDYRLSCDGIINCPRSSNAISSRLFPTISQTSADEYSRGLVCYTPTVNWFLIAIILFSITNIGLLLLISYLGLLRRYSPLRYFFLQSACFRYVCCCLPTRWRHRLIGNLPMMRRNSISSNDLDLPLSPPTYTSVEHADKTNLINQQNSRRHFGWGRQKPMVFAESGHQLPPSYSDVNEEIGVIPDAMIHKIKALQTPSSASTVQPASTFFRGRSKPPPQRFRRPRRRTDLGVELRAALRRTASRTRALVTSGFRVVRIHSANQPDATNQEAIPTRREVVSTSHDEPPHPPPNYTEFLRGDYPRYPTVVMVDHAASPSSGPVDVTTPLMREPRRRRSRRRRL